MAIALPALSKFIIGDEDLTDIAVKVGGLLLNSLPIATAMSILAYIAVWNLEHIVIYKEPWEGGAWQIKRISTLDTSNIASVECTPLAPPVLSAATRMLDAGADTAEIGANMLQNFFKDLQSQGLLGTFIQTLFGKQPQP